MKKESLTMENIKKDLRKSLNDRSDYVSEWRLLYIIPLTLISLILAFSPIRSWIWIPFFLWDIYHIVRYVLQLKELSTSKKLLRAALDRGDFAVSKETLERVGRETVYRPYRAVNRTRTTSEVPYLYFQSGIQWEIPKVTHYEWSKEYHMSSSGLDHTSVKGDEFYLISLQADHEIAYAYNTKFFELAENLSRTQSENS